MEYADPDPEGKKKKKPVLEIKTELKEQLRNFVKYQTFVAVSYFIENCRNSGEIYWKYL